MAGRSSFERAVAALDMPLQRYLLTVVLPVSAVSIVLGVAIPFILPGTFDGFFWLIPWAIPVVAVGGVLVYPFSVASQRGAEIDHNMHYFITHLGTLATSRVPPVQLFELIGEKKTEYGALADECEKIASLVTDWNMGLAEACRFVAKRTPSELFSDFLERFAFGIESGTEIEAYLVAEQDVVMADYETLYKETIQAIEDIKALFNGAMMTMIFLVMFALMMVVLVDVSPSFMMTILVLVVALVQGLFLLMTRLKVPPDPVWASDQWHTPLWGRIKVALPVAVLLTLVLGPLLFIAFDWPAPITLALACTPLVVPGFLASKEETTVKRRDDNYPGFMRSLGSSAAARGGDERAVLKHLRHHDFGPLTNNIRNLFKRLQLRLDDEASWAYFTTESGSRLVERFTQMYDEAVEAGGEPDDVGVIISDNMVRIVGLRKLRYQQAGTFRGVVFGIAAGAAFALFIGIGVLKLLSDLFSGIGDVEGGPVSVPTLVHVDQINLPVMQVLALMILVVNAGMSSVLVRLVDGGTHVRDLEDFSVLMWVSMATAWGSTKLMQTFVEIDVTV